MKNVKIITSLAVGFTIMELVLIVSLYTGYTGAKQIMSVDNPEVYLSNLATFTAVEFIVMMIVATGISVQLTMTIKKALAQMTKVADELAMGKVDVKFEWDRNDEFGMLMKDMQKVVDNTRYNAQIAQEVADGNMTIEVQPKCDEDVMGHALKKLVTQNKHAISNIKDAAHQVSTGSSQVASASDALAEGSTEQASAIQQITASITDVAEKTKQNASQANDASDLISQAIETVKKGNKEMQDMVVAMEEINKSSESISKIIKVIDDIAFQTNILALNAAVEAARAGDAGKGFAVVAEEVRNLAAKSAAAAAETAELIEDSIHKVEAGSKIADDTAKALAEITTVVQQSEVIITDIAEASNYQATAIAQIDQAVDQVSQVVQTNSATSEECAAASLELSNQANRVRDLLSTYKLDSQDGMGRRYDSAADKNEQIISLKGKY